ncbi:MAG: hypothetical protein K1X39_12185 [Thermoflexales bacterium]|nr:hypothetical protein [Thermoflexales bacterium]
MRLDDPLLRSKLAPPRAARRMLARPRLMAALAEGTTRAVTLLQAPTGYGKSTTLASWLGAREDAGWAWYTIGDDDTEPARFLAHLIEALRLRLADFPTGPSARLAEAVRSDEGWLNVVDALVNALDEAGELVLILDDVHHLGEHPAAQRLLDRLLTHLPPGVHLMLATRVPLGGSAMATLRARGQVIDIGREALAFQPAEIGALFAHVYGMQLAPAEIEALARTTEGWPMALQLVWQTASSEAAQRDEAGLRQRRLSRALAGGASGQNALFDYLARDVLRAQPREVQDFLLETAVLRDLRPEACDAVTTVGQGAAATLRRLHEGGLFVIALDEPNYRYHTLFHEFLRATLAREPERAEALHRRAAGWFRVRGDAERAAEHALAGGDFDAAAGDIATAGRAALEAGRLKMVAGWLAALPPELTAERPALQLLQGDLARLRSRFEEAEACYARAERIWRAREDMAGVGQALRARVAVYLDTVQPARAEALLVESMRLAGQTAGTAAADTAAAHAGLLRMLAENRLNAGFPAEAARLRAEAVRVSGGPADEDALSARIMLRTGRLDEAVRTLDAWVDAERVASARGEEPPPRAHRDTQLLLSLIESLRGNGERALALAQAGLALSERLGAPFMTAVAQARCAHALQLAPATRSAAIDSYHTALGLADRLDIRRFRAEPLWALTRAHGLSGDLAAARRAATEGLEIARWAGDAWIAAQIELALGAALTAARQFHEAETCLLAAQRGFEGCDDALGITACEIWRARALAERGEPEAAVARADAALALTTAHDYAFLWMRPTLTGVAQPRRLIPLLIETRRRGSRADDAARLLERLGLPGLERHPGYQLRVQTLGGFRVWRGEEAIEPREWQRDKARQLFELFITLRGQPLQRDAITERLWPALGHEAAQRDFKVALNAMYRVLEPARAPESPSAYIARDGGTYWLRGEADIWIDALAFETEVSEALRALERCGPAAADFAGRVQALDVARAGYRGDYLPEAVYEDWSRSARERLLGLYLRAGERLAEARLAQGQPEAALRACEDIVARDACWEAAYRLMMEAYLRLDNRGQAMRAYQRCVAVLRAELEVAPSVATEALAARLSG